MKLMTQETIDAPIEAVWDRLTDFDRLEALSRDHAEVTRVPDADQPTWNAVVSFRGAQRNMCVFVTKMRGPDVLHVNGEGSGMEADIKMSLEAITPAKTVLTMSVLMRGKTFTGKAIVHGLKLARGTAQEKFEKRIRAIAKSLSKGLA